MSRISHCFEKLSTDGRTALIPYITAGDPVPEVTVTLLHALVEAGADIIELGIPFSDPMSDGPVIQKACERALKNNVSLAHVLKMVAEFRLRNSETPIVLMGYSNPIEAMGYDSFAEQAQLAGIDGVLTVDMPPEESDDLRIALDARQIETIFLVAPTTGRQRIQKVTAQGQGFIYYVSLKGVTGVADIDTTQLEQKLNELREHTELPIAVGFGIKDGQSAAAVSQVADGVVVGSTLVNCIAQHQDDIEAMPSAVANILAEMRHAINANDMAK